LALALVIAPIPARAQEAEALRRETGAAVACMFGVAILLWSGLARPWRRRGTAMEETS
jgi:hypothetical protein